MDQSCSPSLRVKRTFVYTIVWYAPFLCTHVLTLKKSQGSVCSIKVWSPLHLVKEKFASQLGLIETPLSFTYECIPSPLDRADYRGQLSRKNLKFSFAKWWPGIVSCVKKEDRICIEDQTVIRSIIYNSEKLETMQVPKSKKWGGTTKWRHSILLEIINSKLQKNISLHGKMLKM